MSGPLAGVRLSAEGVQAVRNLCNHVARCKPAGEADGLDRLELAGGVVLAQIVVEFLEASPPYFGHLTRPPRPGEARRPSAGEPDQDPQTGDVYGGLNP